MWRSARCKRAVNSTLAGETIAMSAALADAEWTQIMIQDIFESDSDRARQDRRESSISGGSPQQLHSLQATASRPFDRLEVSFALIKECAGSRQDRRTAVDFAIVRETLKAQGSHIRWIPHPLMLADSMVGAVPVLELETNFLTITLEYELLSVLLQ